MRREAILIYVICIFGLAPVQGQELRQQAVSPRSAGAEVVAGAVGAVISAENTSHDFGEIYEDDGVATCQFTLSNTGEAPLVLTQVNASCGCTVPEWSGAPVAPGDTTTIKVSYDPKRRVGPFHKTISVYSNARNASFHLSISGTVLSGGSGDDASSGQQ
ncbi:MAG: DUF1573 domain-containing protein [Tannerellaceae bacterium]|jgi:hypothetical protein|nr:DUF1573 domain-containing protein [Tannerellaceae bacterium]